MSSEPLHWPWSVLDLPPESRSPRDVKRAYARRLKKIDMAADPEGFQALRQAYEMARSIADHEQAQEARPQDAPLPRPLPVPAADIVAEAAPPEPQPGAPAEPARPPQESAAAPEPQAPQEAEALIAQMQASLKDRDFDLALWRGYLNKLTPLSIDEASWFESELVEGLLELTGTTLRPDMRPSHDWRDLIEARFGWRADGLRFQRRFPHATGLWEFWARKRPPKLYDDLEEKLTRPEARSRWKFDFLALFSNWKSWLIAYLIGRFVIRLWFG